MTNSAVTRDQNNQWVEVCSLSDLTPNTGVCALVDHKQVAIFYSGTLNELFAIDNFDPIGKANVLSRGIIGTQGEQVCVASPLYKQHFDLRTGQCLEDPEHSVSAYPIKVVNNQVCIAVM